MKMICNGQGGIDSENAKLILRAIVLLAIALLSTLLSRAQESEWNLDSLEQTLDTITSPQERNYLLILISDAYRFSNKDKSERFAFQALEEAKAAGDDALVADSYFQLEQSFFFQDDYEKALLYIDSAIVLYAKRDDPYWKGTALQVKGSILSFMGKYNEAYQSLLLAQETQKDEEYKDELNNTRVLIASVFDCVKEYSQSASLYQEAIRHFKSKPDQIYYYEDISFALSHYGVHLYTRGLYKEALETFKELDQLAKEVQDPYGEVGALVYIGLVYANLEQFDSSGYYCNRAFEISEFYEDEYEKLLCYKCLGMTYQGQNRLDETGKVFLKAALLADTLGVLQEQMEMKKYLTDYYKIKGDHKKALAYHEAFKTYSDSTFNVAKSAQLSLLQTQYNIDQKVKANLQLRQQLRDKTLQSTLYLIAIVLAVALSIVLFMLFRLQKRNKNILEGLVKKRTRELKKSNVNLQQANKELKEFAYITSHDLKEPIRNINTYAFLTLRKVNNKETEEAAAFLEHISKSAIQLSKLVDDVFNFIQLEEMQVAKTSFLLTDVVEEVSAELYELAQQKRGRIVQQFLI
jgi:tetratricopeptide (TPR) repeat protein